MASMMDPQESRERFFARLRQQLRRLPPDGRTAHPGPRPRPPWRQEGDDGPLEQAAPATRLAWARRFAAEWQALGGRVYGVPRQDAVGQKVADIVTSLGVRSLLRTGDPRWDDTDVDERLRQAGVEVSVWSHGQADRQQAAAAEMGLTWADAAAARTGTVVETSSPQRGRIVSLLPLIHLVVVRVDDILPDRGAVFAHLKAQGTTFRTLSLITGPSRTGDIQNDLTIGVHGPKEALALLVGIDEEDLHMGA